jgi:HEAT repeat protein
MLRSAVVVVALTLLAAPKAHAQFLGKDANEWAAELARGDDAQRRRAAFALGKLRGAAMPAIGALKRAAESDRSAKVREAAAYALGEIALHEVALGKDADLVALLTKSLRDGDPLVRRSAAYALGCLAADGASARQDVEAVLADENAEVRQTAVWALGSFGDEAAPALRRALADADALVIRDAAMSLGQLDARASRVAINELAQLAGHADAEVKKKALLALVGMVKPADAKSSALTAPLQRAVLDADEEVRRGAAFALCNIGGATAAPAIDVLLETLKEGDLEAKRQAAAAFGNIGPAAERGVPELMTHLLDPDAELRGNACMALGGIGRKAEAAVDPLVAILTQRKEPAALRAKAAVALSLIGDVKSAAAAVPKLLAVASNPDDDGRVRERTMWALRVHNTGLRSFPDVPTAFGRILTEPATKDNRMVRQDCAYLYAMVFGPKSPPEVFPVLLEYLKDESLTVYSSTTTVVGGASQETTPGRTASREIGKGDGRRLVLDALTVIGPGVVRNHPEILEQIARLAESERAEPSFRKQCRDYLRTVTP